ncbi:Reducing polyketide synthase rads1 [Agyrium rufum]|nr:Reducing polyketide synthase rads1 [Agyrium rufum]
MPSISQAEDRIPIAIIGLACRFPGDATDPSKFWDLLKSGKSAHSATTDRFNADAFYHPKGSKRQNVLPVKGGHFIKQDPYVFDAAFFNITAAEAMAFDPKQRIAMEVAYEALENAGLPLQKVAGTQTSCFMGSSMSDYREAVARDFGHAPKYHLLGTSEEMVSNRISHFLDIHGPSATVQTACSSSHVATHLACQSLHSGEANMAIAGGIGMMLSPDSIMHLNNLGFLSQKGQSRAFDADAGGYGRGEGCGVLIMKRLDRAIEDGDTVRAIIRASGVNSDGWTPGVTMPSSEAQAALIKRVYESHGLDFAATQYVEAHGTGTKAGDPVETSAIYRTIGQPESSRSKLWIGSVKPNIGHLEAAAGVASIIKGVLAMEHGLIPPNIHYDKPNPEIPLEKWGMAVPSKLTPWPACQTKRMSVSGFGMGGTNAHFVLEEGRSKRGLNGLAQSTSPKKRLFTISSHDQAGFSRQRKALIKHLDELGPGASSSDYLANLAYTLAKSRSGFLWKATCVAESAVGLREQLEAEVIVGENAARVSNGQTPRIGFVFTGQGAQWARMGIEMMERRVFRESVELSTSLLREMGCEWDPVAELTKEGKESRLGVPEISQPICSILQIALVDELRSWDITPLKVVGHSSGEIAAAYSAGALSHRDALAVAFFRGKAAAGLRNRRSFGKEVIAAAGMMAVGCSREEADVLLAEGNIHATVACVNSPSSTTISGAISALDALESLCKEKSIFARKLKVDVAYHSAYMHACSAEYAASIADLDPVASSDEEPVIMVSSVTGEEVDLELLGPYYWVRNMISPVLFQDALKEMVSPEETDGKNAIDLLIEIGPHSALGGPVEQILSHYNVKNVAYLSMLTRGQNAIDTSLSLASKLFIQGVTLDIAQVNGDLSCHLLTNLPPYAWNHSQVFRADSRIQREYVMQKFPTKSLLGALMPTMDEGHATWRSFIRLDEEPWLRDHTVGTTVLFPGAGMISIALEAAQQMVDPGKTPRSFKMRDVSFLAAMALPEDIATEVILHMRPHLVATTGSTPATWWEFTVSSATGSTGQLRNNCRGMMTIEYKEQRSTQMVNEDRSIEMARIAEYHDILRKYPDVCSKKAFYDQMASSAFKYGEFFQGVENCHIGCGKTAFEVKYLDIGETFSLQQLERPFLINAATLDAIFQGSLGSTGNSDNSDFGFDKPFLPTAVGELEISLDIPAEVGYMMPGLCHSQKHGFNEWSSSITMFNKELSKVYLSITDFRLLEVEMGDVDKAEDVVVDPAEITSEPHWNYSLDVIEPAEIGQVVSNSAAINDKLLDVIQMAVHQRPTTNIIELVPSHEKLANTLASKLPEGMILPNQVRYALMEGTGDEQTNNKVFGQPFALGAADTTLSPDLNLADLIVVPDGVDRDAEDFNGVLERLFSLAKPDALVLVAGLVAGKEIAFPAFQTKGLQLSSFIPSGSEGIALYKQQLPKEVADGRHQKDIVILGPSTSSAETQSFSRQLSTFLQGQGHTVTVKLGLSDIIEGKTYISLLELEQPLLATLSESGFQGIRKLMLSCERLLWITRGDNPMLGMADGFLRVMRSEIAGVKFQLLHLSSGGPTLGPALAARILEKETIDSEFKERDGLLQISRIYKSVKENNHVRNHLEDSTRVMSLIEPDDKVFHRLVIGKPGLMDTLRFVREDHVLLPPLADHEVQIEVKVSGVNFRDIMTSMALITGRGLGQEASGVVLRTGSKASEKFKPGDRVSTLTLGGTHATKTICDYRATQKIPNSMSFEEAAAVAVVHVTAYFALINLAKLRRGQSVLIHAAAGGVGQAAVQLATYLGLTVYVTVGTEDKRELIKERYGIPDDHIFYSRDASFVKGVMRMTSGRGVDCVLNSLSGELLRVSWGCLATFGTFVEIGLRDITDNMRLDMRPFSKSTTFTFINVNTLLEQAPDVVGEILDKVFELLHANVLRTPYPLTVYPVSQVEDAFRIMLKGKHRGKMLLSFTEGNSEVPLLSKSKDSLKLDPNATYLFVGGLGGLGRSLAMEFVASGARHIAFVSRSGDTKPEAKAVVEELTERGACVKVYRSDIADAASFLLAMEQCSNELPPIRGVIQMAMVLRDVVFEKMTYDEWTLPLQSKVQGTDNIHQYFDHMRPLDFMVLCSSQSGVCGNPSQAQYAAGNTYQDALAHYRRAQGLKAVSVNLGIMRDVGILAETGSHALKIWEEVLGIGEPAFHALMKSLINGQMGKRGARGGEAPVQLCTGLGSSDLLAMHRLAIPAYFADPRIGPLTVSSLTSNAGGTGSEGSAIPLATRLADADASVASTIIAEALVNKIADILRIPPSEVDASKPMYQYGVDSLVALEVRNWITREMKANMALLEILAAVPMATFAGQIASKSKLVQSVVS